MTSQGTAHGRFTRAGQQRNLWAAETFLRELGTPSLEEALAYLDVLADERCLRGGLSSGAADWFDAPGGVDLVEVVVSV